MFDKTNFQLRMYTLRIDYTLNIVIRENFILFNLLKSQPNSPNFIVLERLMIINESTVRVHILDTFMLVL